MLFACNVAVAGGGVGVLLSVVGLLLPWLLPLCTAITCWASTELASFVGSGAAAGVEGGDNGIMVVVESTVWLLAVCEVNAEPIQP